MRMFPAVRKWKRPPSAGLGSLRYGYRCRLGADMPGYGQVKRNRDLSLHADPYFFFCFFSFFFFGLLCLFLFLPTRSSLRHTMRNAGCNKCFGGQQDPHRDRPSFGPGLRRPPRSGTGQSYPSCRAPRSTNPTRSGKIRRRLSREWYKMFSRSDP